jgi:PAT family beta-lactamase induction signal transducer AmpG
MATGLLATWFAPREEVIGVPKTIGAAVVEPFRNLLKRREIGILLLIVLVFKLGDAFGSSLLSAFMRRGLDFDPAEIGATRKIVGVASVFAGTFLAAWLMERLTLARALLVFGIFQAVTNLGFVALVGSERSLWSLMAVIAGENLATGMGQVPFLVLLTALCDRRFSATQFALLSALANLGTVFIGPVAGPTAEYLGWSGFFLVSCLFALPGLWLVAIARKSINAVGSELQARPASSG